MTNITLRPAHAAELEALSALLMRSKAHWGYDAEFMAACVEELTVTTDDLANSHVIVAEVDGTLAGMAQVGLVGDDADLERMFIDPPFIGTGVGRKLFDWCVDVGRSLSNTRMLIEADPQAQPFYERMGARQFGGIPSGSIPGRVLPHMEYLFK